MKTKIGWIRKLDPNSEVGFVLAKMKRKDLLRDPEKYAVVLAKERTEKASRENRISKNRDRNKAARKARKNAK